MNNEKLRLMVAKATGGKVMLTDDDIEQAREFLNTLQDIEFGTIQGKMDVQGGVVSVLAITNTKQGNGDFTRFVESLMAKYDVVVFQCVMNVRLQGWLRRHDFVQATSGIDFVWQKP